jgi:hypothetical protein
MAALFSLHSEGEYRWIKVFYHCEEQSIFSVRQSRDRTQKISKISQRRTPATIFEPTNPKIV